MTNYIQDTEFAASILINAIFGEEKRIQEISEGLKMYEYLYWDFSTADLHEDFNELQVQHKFYKMADYYKKNKIEDKLKEKEKLEEERSNKIESLNALSMSLLQIAKQGISIVHQGLRNCPCGRSLGNETLKNVIWQARNQSIHFEENNFREPILSCFDNLKNDYGEKFNIQIEVPENKAKDVIELLGWNHYGNYLTDMKSLLE